MAKLLSAHWYTSAWIHQNQQSYTIGSTHPKAMWSLSHCTINELLESFYFNFAIKIISYDFHRIVISFILSFIVSITCVIFRLGCSLKTEFMRAILAALRRASAFVGQVCDIDIDIVIIVNLLGKSVILILILWSLAICWASLWHWYWYCDHCQFVAQVCDIEIDIMIIIDCAFVGQFWSVLLSLKVFLISAGRAMESVVGIVIAIVIVIAIGIGKSGWYSDQYQSVRRGSDQCGKGDGWSDLNFWYFSMTLLGLGMLSIKQYHS